MGQPSERVEARWRALIAEQQQSGQSAAAFCCERSLRDGPFYEWKKRLRAAETSPFVAVEIAAAEATVPPLPVAPGSGIPLEIRLRHGRTLLVGPDFNAAHLRRLFSVELKASELAMLLDGIDLSKLKRTPRYQAPNGAASPHEKRQAGSVTPLRA